MSLEVSISKTISSLKVRTKNANSPRHGFYLIRRSGELDEDALSVTQFVTHWFPAALR